MEDRHATPLQNSAPREPTIAAHRMVGAFATSPRCRGHVAAAATARKDHARLRLASDSRAVRLAERDQRLRQRFAPSSVLCVRPEPVDEEPQWLVLRRLVPPHRHGVREDDVEAPAVEVGARHVRLARDAAREESEGWSEPGRASVLSSTRKKRTWRLPLPLTSSLTSRQPRPGSAEAPATPHEGARGTALAGGHILPDGLIRG
jgi:hypothetical protein